MKNSVTVSSTQQVTLKEKKKKREEGTQMKEGFGFEQPPLSLLNLVYTKFVYTRWKRWKLTDTLLFIIFRVNYFYVQVTMCNLK